MVDWQLVGISFLAVFLAELGDKSQLAAMALSGRSRSTWGIFLGTAGALVLASFLGVIAGEGMAQILPVKYLKAMAAIGFALLAFGLLKPQRDE